MVTALERVVADHPGEMVVVVSHADPIKAAIAHYTGTHLDLFQRIVVSPASVTVFELSAARRGDAEVQRHRLARRAPPARRPRKRDEESAADGGEGEVERDERRSSSSTTSTVSAPARSANPGQRAFYIQARTEHAQLTVLVEKEQVALLATEAVAFLDRIADDYPELPFDVPTAQTQLREPTVPLFRARLIGLGFDPERELVLLELRERRPTKTTTTTTMPSPSCPSDDDEVGYVARIYATRAQVRAMAARGAEAVAGGRPPCPLCEHADGSRRAPVSPLELTPDELADRARRRRARGRRPHALLVERDVPRGGEASRAWRCRRSTSRAAANVRSGTSRRARSANREVAAYELSRALGWDIVPLTILRDGPLGEGAVQRFVEHDPDEHYFTLLDGREDRFRQFAVFDVLANNTDRKGGHCLHDQVNDVIVGIDHGLTFHAAWKLRTVIWDFAGERVPDRRRRRRVPRRSPSSTAGRSASGSPTLLDRRGARVDRRTAPGRCSTRASPIPTTAPLDALAARC